MFNIDHLMVEVDDPLAEAEKLSERLGLPLAWPLTEQDDYTSIGVNLGDINIELIKFSRRFGIANTHYSGFSGIAFNVSGSIDDAIERLQASQLHYRIGEQNAAHTTIPVEETHITPTIFLVKYHFDTSGWQQRLKQEFQAYGGGEFALGRFKSLAIKAQMPTAIMDQFNIDFADKHRLTFESTNDTTAVLDVIDNLEIVIVPKPDNC